MDYYYAPMEGITGYIQRNALEKYFPGIKKYFTPFIAPNEKGNFSSKEKNDIRPEHNQNMYTVPQILTNDPEDFILSAKKLQEYGYHEINLNLGCPSKTVVTKFRGAGFLEKCDQLDRFFDKIFTETDLEISVKTRIGCYEPEEWKRIFSIYEKYPMKEIIVHPRTQTDYYKHPPRWEIFQEIINTSHHSICYNGDLFSPRIIKEWKEKFPGVDKVMIGRGLLMNPALIQYLETGKMPDKIYLREYHDCILDAYSEVLYGDRNILFKMKELWTYMIYLFMNAKKYGKRIKKAEKLSTYLEAVDDLFYEQELIKNGEADSNPFYKTK